MKAKNSNCHIIFKFYTNKGVQYPFMKGNNLAFLRKRYAGNKCDCFGNKHNRFKPF